MGKSLTKEQRKNHKYLKRDFERQLKEAQFIEKSNKPERPARKPKWRPHSEIAVE